MSNNKPRHDPDKPQNKIGKHCSYYEGFNGQYWCERDGILENAREIHIIVQK